MALSCGYDAAPPAGRRVSLKVAIFRPDRLLGAEHIPPHPESLRLAISEERAWPKPRSAPTATSRWAATKPFEHLHKAEERFRQQLVAEAKAEVEGKVAEARGSTETEGSRRA